MLTSLIDVCLRHRPVVLLATAALAWLGLSSLRELPFDAFPDTTPVQVQVNTVDATLSPLEVERRLTFPVEQALFGLPGLSEVRSISKFGLSQVTVIFDDDVELPLARQVVSERLASADLPESAGRPTLGPLTTGLGEVFQYVLHGDLSPRELRTLHHWVIRPQMLRVPGVAEINTWGGEDKQLHVIVDPVALVKHELTLDDVARVLREGNRNASGGLVDVAGEAQLLQGRGLVRGVEDLRAMVVAHAEGTPIHLRDVAEVREGDAIRRGAVTSAAKAKRCSGSASCSWARTDASSRSVSRPGCTRSAADSRGRRAHRGLPPHRPDRRGADRIRDNLLGAAGDRGALRLPRQPSRGPDRRARDPAVDAFRVRRDVALRGRRQPHGPRRDRLRAGGRQLGDPRRERVASRERIGWDPQRAGDRAGRGGRGASPDALRRSWSSPSSTCRSSRSRAWRGSSSGRWRSR
ncbi:MAG: efflux RND transporter permease subunit [Polyangiales bacterium]